MRRITTGLSIALAVTIGVAATWYWTSRGVESTDRHTSHLESGAPENSASPERLPTAAPPVESATPRSIVSSGAIRDDSTYDRMLAFAQSDPGSANTARDIIEKRERFLATADDPDWARPTEQALRDFLQTKTAAAGPQITSVSCRSAGCEVQALSTPLCPPGGCELQAQSERSAGRVEPDNVDPIGPLREDWPADLPLRRQAIITLVVDDRAGIIVTYSREARKP